MTISVLLADDHAFFRSGFRAAVETQDDLVCVADVGNGRDAVDRVLALGPDVAVLDVRMPKLDGLEATAAILAAGSPTKVLLLTTYDDDEYVHRALELGASGFLLKSTPAHELVAAIRVVARGDALIDPAVTRRLASRFAQALRPAPSAPGLELLTAREREVLVLVGTGAANSEIAARLHVGEETVKTHVSRVLRKLDLRDRVQAAVYANRHGLAPRGDGRPAW
ncbi:MULTISPECIES: response regulator transcription factor [Actinosynnema]|uniref:response regulator n=1 Tax=Actinosynnema TaxID=40566 RepID=UPI0020A54C19|nr:response regulator transcription factor [Actinosynnema pretiosum]MCP2098430.1 DNA-binding response regulator, NarL/FixJ family, contains REC and HTH domains [Actinosynnema pretiosum]